jgi:hypothetical protein
MKAYKIKKKDKNLSIKIVSHLRRLPKPRLPRRLFTKVHEVKETEWVFPFEIN